MASRIQNVRNMKTSWPRAMDSRSLFCASAAVSSDFGSRFHLSPIGMTKFVTFIKSQRDATEEKVKMADRTMHTFSGAAQMCDLASQIWDSLPVPGELRETYGALTPLFKSALVQKGAEMQRQAGNHKISTAALDAQRIAFDAVVSWADHFGRGGTLDA